MFVTWGPAKCYSVRLDSCLLAIDQNVLALTRMHLHISGCAGRYQTLHIGCSTGQL